MARILMVMRPGKGGAFAHVTQLCGALSARDHQVAVCGPHADKAAGLAAEVLPVEIVRPLSPTGDARAIAGVMAAVRRFRPDLIHAHGSKGGVIARLSRVVRPRTPLVFTPHQYAFENYFDGGGRRVAYEAIERVLAPLATRVIGVCEAERRLAATIGPGRRTRLVYNGIEPLPRVPPIRGSPRSESAAPPSSPSPSCIRARGSPRCSRPCPRCSARIRVRPR